MRGIWARASCCLSCSSLWRAAQTRRQCYRLREGELAGNPRSEEALCGAPTANNGTTDRSRGAAKRKKHWYSKYWLQNPKSLQRDSAALSSFLPNKYIKADTDCWILIFKSSLCHIRESLASSFHPWFPAREIPEAKHLICPGSSYWYGNQMNGLFAPQQFPLRRKAQNPQRIKPSVCNNMTKIYICHVYQIVKLYVCYLVNWEIKGHWDE